MEKLFEKLNGIILANLELLFISPINHGERWQWMSSQYIIKLSNLFAVKMKKAKQNLMC